MKNRARQFPSAGRTAGRARRYCLRRERAIELRIAWYKAGIAFGLWLFVVGLVQL
jgi:hypothetical protein